MTISNKKNKKQKTSLKYWHVLLIAIFSSVVFLGGCKAKKSLVISEQSTVNSNQSIVAVDKLTPVAVPGDSSKLKALFRCDSLNNVLLIGISEEKSKNMQSAFSFQNGQLKYNATTKPDTAFIKSTDRFISRNITKTLTITRTETIIKIEKQKGVFWWIGLVTSILICGFIAFKLLKKPIVSTVFQRILKTNK